MFSCLTRQQLPRDTGGTAYGDGAYGDADLMTLSPPDSGSQVPSTDNPPTEEETIFKLQPLLYEPLHLNGAQSFSSSVSRAGWSGGPTRGDRGLWVTGRGWDR